MAVIFATKRHTFLTCKRRNFDLWALHAFLLNVTLNIMSDKQKGRLSSLRAFVS